MPNEKTHFIAGAIVGATVNFAIQSAEMAMDYDRKFDWGEFFLCAGAGAFAGLAGGLYAIFNGFISSDALYWTASGDILIMAMLGGAGTLIGPVIGTGIFLLMKNVVSSYSEHWLSIIGITFICCVMFFPGGVWGAVQELRWARPSP